jgi:hypothetical protein
MASSTVVSGVKDATLDKLAEKVSAVIVDLEPRAVRLKSNYKKRLIRLGNRSFPFVERVAQIAAAEPKFIPSFVDGKEFAQDVTEIGKLFNLRSMVSKLAVQIDNLYALYGDKVNQDANAIYLSIKDAQNRGIPNAKVHYDTLRNINPRKKSKKAMDLASKTETAEQGDINPEAVQLQNAE